MESASTRSPLQPRILLFDPDLHHAREVIDALRYCKCEIVAVHTVERMTDNLNESEFTVLIVADNRIVSWRAVVQHAQKLAEERRRALHILYLARAYRGPHDRLEAEKHGVRFLYES